VHDEVIPGWEEFLRAHADMIYCVIGTLARTYDDRMDLFLFVCAGLRANEMRRVRRFRHLPEAPCRFTTYLTVVVRRLALDYERSRRGRERPFQSLTALDSTDRLILEYRIRRGKTIDELRDELRRRHGVDLAPAALADRIARVERTLSPSQRWRLLSRWAWRRPTLPVDPVRAIAGSTSAPVPLRSGGVDPEACLRADDAGRTFADAVSALPARQQLVIALRFRDGLDIGAAATSLGVSSAQIERNTRDALTAIREVLGAAHITREELERACGTWWRSGEERR